MRRLLIGLVRLYRGLLSPMTRGACRHIPSCSQYAEDAIRSHGSLRGTWLALQRLLRCHPWGTFGFDPVPPGAGSGRDKAAGGAPRITG